MCTCFCPTSVTQRVFEIHPAAMCIDSLSLFIAQKYSTACKYSTGLIIHILRDICTTSHLTITNKVALNVLIQMFGRHLFSFLSDKDVEVEILGHREGICLIL